jgi:histidine phosphotransferase ChpT
MRGEAAKRIEAAVMQPADTLRLAELIAIRLCHDLSGPLGTLMGALELVTKDPQSAAEALPLASDVSAALGRRLRVLRAAWGGATASLSIADFAALADGAQMRRGGRIDLGGLDPAGRFAPAAARVALNVVLLAAEALPGGGTAAFLGDPASDVVVTLAGPRAAWPSGFAAYLGDESLAWQSMQSDDTQASRGIQAALTVLIARASGIRLSLLLSPAADAVPPLLMNFAGR